MKAFLKSRNGWLSAAVCFTVLAVPASFLTGNLPVLSGACLGGFGGAAGVCWYRWQVHR